MSDHSTTPSPHPIEMPETRDWTQKVMPEPPPSPTRPHTPEQIMPEPEDIPPVPMPRAVAPLPPFSDPEVSRRHYEDEIVGPNGETRRGMRMKVLAKLDQLEQEVGTQFGLEGIKMRLRIHSQRCALLGLPWSGGDLW